MYKLANKSNQFNCNLYLQNLKSCRTNKRCKKKSFSLGTKSEVHSLLLRVFPIEPASTIQTGFMFIAGGNTKVVLC